MGVTALASIAAILLAAQTAAVEQEPDRLQGTWRILTNESSDIKLDEAYNRRDNYHVVIKGNIWSWRSNSVGDYDVTFRLGPVQKAKQLDLHLRDGKPMNECIYELDGDALRVCIARFGQPRPEKFVASAKASLVVLRRVKK